MNQPNANGPTGLPDPWYALIIVIVLVVILSAFSATKKWAYWIGAIALVALLLPAWRKAGYPTGF